MRVRETYIDHLRGFIFALMAFDHALHAYAQNWGRFWFIQDFERNLVWDVFYLFDQSIIMPMIFFISGLYVLPSLERRGIKEYLKHRFLKFGIPFILCIPLIVPLLSFPRYQLTIDPSIEYGTYWKEIFFFDKMQAGPLWVCYALFLFSLILVCLNILLPSFVPALGRWIKQTVLQKPLKVLLIVMAISAFILGITDLVWGAPWWIGFWKVFYLQGARFLLYALYFVLGAGVRASELLKDASFLENFSSRWRLWLGLMLVTGFCYTGYAIHFFNKGAYNDDFRHHTLTFFAQGGSWTEFWSFMLVYGFELLKSAAPGVLIRTSLHGVLCIFQALFLLSIFYRFCIKPTYIWQSLARCCYAIFLTHEMVVIWLQYGLIGVGLPPFVKIFLVFGLGFGGSWLISDKILLKIPSLKKILG